MCLRYRLAPRAAPGASARAIRKADRPFPAPALRLCHRRCCAPSRRFREYAPPAPQTSESRHPARVRGLRNGGLRRLFRRKSFFLFCQPEHRISFAAEADFEAEGSPSPEYSLDNRRESHRYERTILPGLRLSIQCRDPSSRRELRLRDSRCVQDDKFSFTLATNKRLRRYPL